MLVDAHCHLDIAKYSEGYSDFSPEKHSIELILQRAKKAGVEHVVTISTSIEDSSENIKIASEFDSEMVFCSVGVHAVEAEEHLQKYSLSEIVSHLEALTKNDSVITIGECGVDYYRREGRTEQIKVFEAQCDLARRSNLPLQVHSREAEADTISVLKNVDCRGTIHCFTGSMNFAKSALDLNFYISFSGIITFKNAESIREVVKYVPLDRILVETDSPFLSPAPYRGKVNEPSHVVYVAQEIAKIKGISFDEVSRITTDNFFDLFDRKKRGI